MNTGRVNAGEYRDAMSLGRKGSGLNAGECRRLPVEARTFECRMPPSLKRGTAFDSPSLRGTENEELEDDMRNTRRRSGWLAVLVLMFGRARA